MSSDNKFNVISAFSTSLKEVALQFSEIIGRNDSIVSVENSDLFSNDDKKKVSEAIDELVLNKESEKTVKLSDGEEMIIMM